MRALENPATSYQTMLELASGVAWFAAKRGEVASATAEVGTGAGAKTPCAVPATPAETLELQAVKGALKGSAKVLAERDQKVTIKLSRAVNNAPPKPAQPRLCEVDGLKILRACK